MISKKFEFKIKLVIRFITGQNFIHATILIAKVLAF